jgi:hypothetical protein
MYMHGLAPQKKIAYMTDDSLTVAINERTTCRFRAVVML